MDIPNITNNVAAHRFELRTDAGLAVLQYELRDGSIELTHTKVPKKAEGQGFAGALVHAALEYARGEKLTVIPTCPFVKGYLAKHAEYADLVKPATA
jgi:predicted GNAT family acetyltransferase